MNIVLTFKKNVKMKKTLHFWLMALLIGGISMAVTSCKDDDKNDGGNNDNEEYVPNELDETDIARLWLTGLTDAEGAFAAGPVEEVNDQAHQGDGEHKGEKAVQNEAVVGCFFVDFHDVMGICSKIISMTENLC